VDWSGRHLTPVGYRGKVETPQNGEEARLPPHRKQVPEAERNGPFPINNKLDENRRKKEAITFLKKHIRLPKIQFIISVLLN
jgi:hypothetical protein